MQYGDGAEQSGGAAGESCQHGEPARREHHGSCADGEHHAVWHVHVAVESVGRSRNGRGLWSADTHALHTCHDVAMGAGCAHGDSGRESDSGQHVYADVLVGRSDPGG